MDSGQTPLDFDSVYAQHAGLVRRVLSRRGVGAADLDDVVQETFITVFKQLPSFEGRARVETWLHAVAWRVAASYRRQSRAWNAADDGDGELALDDRAKLQYQLQRLHVSFQRLSPEERDLLSLHEAGGLSITQLADLTGSARTTIRQRLQQGRATLERDIQTFALRVGGAGGHETPAFEDDVGGPRTHCDYIDRDACISRVDDTIILLTRGASTVTTLEALMPILLGASDRATDGITFLSVIERTSTPPTRTGRLLMGEMTKRIARSLRAAAWAAESSSRLSMVVPVMNACMFLARTQLNARFFLDVKGAARWLTQQVPEVRERALRVHVETMRGWLDTACQTVPSSLKSNCDSTLSADRH